MVGLFQLSVDGSFGPETLRRVTAFQVLAGVPARGVVVTGSGPGHLTAAVVAGALSLADGARLAEALDLGTLASAPADRWPTFAKEFHHAVVGHLTLRFEAAASATPAVPPSRGGLTSQ